MSLGPTPALPTYPPVSSRPSGRGWTAFSRLLLGATIVLAGFALRVVALGDPSFWWDDSYSTMVASSGLRDIVATLAREDFHPPLYYFLLHFWLRVVGTSEFSLRFLSIIAGVLAVAAGWTAGRRLFGRLAAPIAAALFALSPYLWYYSQEARMFALVPLFGSLALYFCVRAGADGRRWSWVGYVVVSTLGVYDFYYFVFVPLACGVWVCLNARAASARRGWLAATAMVGMLYLPWIPIFVARGSAWSNGTPSLETPIKIIVWSWPAFLLGLPTLSLYGELIPSILLALGALVTVAALVWGWGALQLPLPLGEDGRLAAVAVVVPLAAMATISAVKPVFHPRYAMPVEAGLLLLLAGFIAYLVGRSGPSRLAGILVAVLLVTCSAYGLVRLRTDGNYARDDYRSAIGYVHANERPGDTIIHNAVPPFWYYYHGPAPATYFPTGSYTEADVAAALNGVTRGRTRLWYVTQIDTPSDPDGYVDAELRLHATRLEEHRYGALRVQLWQIPGNDAFAGPTFQPMTANLANELAITGYAASGEPVGGHPLDVELRLETRRVPSADDGFWVALVDAAGQEWGRADARPHDAGFNPSSRWSVGTTVVVRADVPIAVGTPPGSYNLVVGAYRLRDLAGLDLLDANQNPIGQRVRLGVITVTRPSDGETDPTLTDLGGRAVTPGLVLVADRIGPSTVRPGDKVPVTLLWRAADQLAALDASLELRDAGGVVLARSAGPIGGAFPTNRWPVGRLVREQRALTVPAAFAGKQIEVTLVSGNAPPVALGMLAVNQIARDFTRPSPTHPVDATFGGQVALIGFDLSADGVKAGNLVTLTLDWHALQTPAKDYHVFVHLLDAQGHVVAQWDGVPKNWTYPTSAWVPEEYVVDHYPLTIPADTPAGPLTLETGLYDPVSGQRLTIVDAATSQTTDRVILGTVQITR